MNSVLSRIVELIGWVVLGFSVLLLFIAHHIDDYKSPEPAATATVSLQKK
ncbi:MULTISPECIES: division septum protein Blr [Enterobacteriaceae]|uniref:Division septum protein Blr n=1 Tax=Kluyvera genomosp. 2 TaxID=2774054 RepID=A0A2T2Y2A7_9ENTR|nr:MULTISPECIES: division septum protein Blr [Enterobacteriaceae]HAT3918363.1 division septum protein Blr [Kluyvera ascorbata]PSR46675.1 division septum protein Blr [Kluyvera genomosp. 2]HAT3943276.1 division septum protein Blr [Kluyvera ascorbata]HAT3948522.1 division septum protein Blr [Kluyvera ascorbata]HAT3953629.1 division septum protein Blr [Kluyvera ascorbata]